MSELDLGAQLTGRVLGLDVRVAFVAVGLEGTDKVAVCWVGLDLIQTVGQNDCILDRIHCPLSRIW